MRGAGFRWWIAGGWAIDLHLADPPGTLRPWQQHEPVAAQVHDIWCRPNPGASWSLQIMVDDAEEGIWHCRRDARITRPVKDLDGPASKPSQTGADTRDPTARQE